MGAGNVSKAQDRRAGHPVTGTFYTGNQEVLGGPLRGEEFALSLQGKVCVSEGLWS